MIWMLVLMWSFCTHRLKKMRPTRVPAQKRSKYLRCQSKFKMEAMRTFDWWSSQLADTHLFHNGACILWTIVLRWLGRLLVAQHIKWQRNNYNIWWSCLSWQVIRLQQWLQFFLNLNNFLCDFSLNIHLTEVEVAVQT